MHLLQIKKLLENQAAATKLQRCNITPETVKRFILYNFKSWKIQNIGKSHNGLPIFSLHSNKGSLKVLLWSQMHGNEPSSTIALLSVLEFLDKQLHPWAKIIMQRLNLRAIPMLNPDGAALLCRRNAMQIDLNRDARRRVAPEAQLLMNQVTDFAPQWAFNLHDQELYYGIENSNKPTVLALLVPTAAQPEKVRVSLNNAQSALGFVVKHLQNHITIAKYSDQYMPNAFGDALSTLGISTFLFETGYIPFDQDRKQATLWNATAIILALYAIATEQYLQPWQELYLQLPQNKKYKFFDVLLRHLPIASANGIFRADVGISRDRRNHEHFTDYDQNFLIFDIGDLGNYHGFIETDCSVAQFFELGKLQLFADAAPLLEHCGLKAQAQRLISRCDGEV